MKDVFDADYKQKYIETGLIPDGNLQHLISDAATMQIIRWTKGKLTDQVPWQSRNHTIVILLIATCPSSFIINFFPQHTL